MTRPAPARPDPESGVVLINVLVILALTSSVVMAMISLSDLSITRSQRFSEAGQALALIAAGETSAIVTLRRDMELASPSDSTNEPWAALAQEPVRITGGSFALQIEDAQARFNLQNLTSGGVPAAQILRRIVEAEGLPAPVADRIIALMAKPDQPEWIADLVAQAAISPDELIQLSPLITLLPERTDININTAPAPVLSALCENPVQARTLLAVRARNGALTPADLVQARLVLLPGAGYRSRYFRVTVSVQIGDTSQSRQSLLQRRTGRAGEAEVVVIGRDAAAEPSPPPPA